MTDPKARLAAALDVIEDGEIRRHVRHLLDEWLRDFAKDHGAAAYREGVEDTKMEHAADLAAALDVIELAAAARHVVAQDYQKRPDLFWAALDMLDEAAKQPSRKP